MEGGTAVEEGNACTRDNVVLAFIASHHSTKPENISTLIYGYKLVAGKIVPARTIFAKQQINAGPVVIRQKE
ncbi:MAG TPA: hypothetical protein VFF11_02070 [Candidatus Binatia bacterium]|nr:hypothetical protein [Candidatus Binatia bacterium]